MLLPLKGDALERKTKVFLNISLRWRRLPLTAATTRWVCRARHGDDRYDAPKTTCEETRERDATLRAAISEHCCDTNLIFGGDATISFRADHENRREVVFSSNPGETVSRVAAR